MDVKRQKEQVIVFTEDKKDSQRATGILELKWLSFLTNENIKGERNLEREEGEMNREGRYSWHVYRTRNQGDE